MIRYFITSHTRLPGVRLSKLGHWGNMPHPDEDAARAAILADAGGQRHAVERTHHRGPSHYPVAPNGERV